MAQALHTDRVDGNNRFRNRRSVGLHRGKSIVQDRRKAAGVKPEDRQRVVGLTRRRSILTDEGAQ